MKFLEMDETVTLASQMETDERPVILINKFNVKPEDRGKLIEAWAADAEFFKAEPGFISAQLHQGIAGSGVFLNYAVWESVERFKEAFNKPEFRSKLTLYPASTVASPHLFKKVAVPGICTE